MEDGHVGNPTSPLPNTPREPCSPSPLIKLASSLVIALLPGPGRAPGGDPCDDLDLRRSSCGEFFFLGALLGLAPVGFAEGSFGVEVPVGGLVDRDLAHISQAFPDSKVLCPSIPRGSPEGGPSRSHLPMRPLL